MKVSKPLVALLALYSFAFADTTLEEYISQNKKELFGYDYDKNEAESLKLRDSWISPLNFSYTHTQSDPYGKEQTSKSKAIKMDQSIFQSGGIYFGIKFAEASRIYSNYSVDVAKKKLIKDAISFLMQIKQMDLKSKKQNLLIKNADINLEQKREGYLSGQLDSGFLDSAIIDRNSLIQALYDIETNKERVISKFHAISDMKYENAPVPMLKLLTQEEFLGQNLALSISNSEIVKNDYAKDLTLTKYLPKVNAIAGYNWDESDSSYQFGPNEKEYYTIGFRVSMPLDINSFRDVESSKISYLKSKLFAQDKKRELSALYEQVMQNIANFEKKMKLSLENQGIYEKLLADTNELYRAGYKTEYDVELLKNSLDVQKIDSEIYEMDKQLELLTLYEMYKDEI